MKLSFSILLFLCFSVSVFAQESSCSCCTSNHNDFDFWIGAWRVINKDSSLAGTNIIQKIQDNCILKENWVSAKGHFTGTSYNFYNGMTNQWEQLWIDNQGGNLHLKGSRKENQMILESEESINEKGQPFYNRISWTLNKDTSVRQLWETITNNKDVTIVFDGLYIKAE
jgi:hypothetical protein